MDRYIKVESLRDGVVGVCEDLGLEFDPTRIVKKNTSKYKKNWRDYYTPELKEIVKQKYRQELDYFGYVW